MSALDSLAFEVIADPDERVGSLREGEVRVASGLDPALAVTLRRDPLLTAVGAAGEESIAFERSVRGIEDAAPAPLSGAWIALLGGG